MEYLGFNLIYKDEGEEDPYVWLEFNNQFLLIWPWNNKLGTARQVVFEVPDICNLFFDLEKRVKVNVPLLGKSTSFSILDCEENIIHFTEEASQVVRTGEQLNVMELAR
jgi:hypothetical protein